MQFRKLPVIGSGSVLKIFGRVWNFLGMASREINQYIATVVPWFVVDAMSRSDLEAPNSHVLLVFQFETTSRDAFFRVCTKPFIAAGGIFRNVLAYSCYMLGGSTARRGVPPRAAGGD